MMQGADDQIKYAGKFLEFRETERGWEYVIRPNCKGVVAILAVNNDKQVVLVEQYRPPVNRNVIELPTGLAGDIPLMEDEPLVVAAKRELKEETGYQAKHWATLTEGPSSAGLSKELITLFHATGLTKVSEGGGDATEDIRVHCIDIPHVPTWCARRREEGMMVDYKIFAALYLAGAGTQLSDSRLWI